MKYDVRQAMIEPPRALSIEGKGQAGVALVLDRADHVLFIRRADKAGDPWSGHVALPGGHVESGETLEQAARREASEEVGLLLTTQNLLGPLDDHHTPAHLPSKIVRPFVYSIDTFPSFTLQEEEVASTHVWPLQRLLANEGRGSFTLPYQGQNWTLPRVDFDGVRLWGLTLRIVDDLLHRLDGRGTGLERLS